MRSIALLSILLLLCGCTKTVTKAELDARSTEHAGGTFPDETYYAGSDERYDFFVIRIRGNGPKNWYRVLQTERAVTNRFSVTKDETKWVGCGIAGVVITNALQLGVTNAVGVPK